MAAAYIWLNTRKEDLQPVTNYLTMIKYQWPDRLRGTNYRPLPALGIPENAPDDPRIAPGFQRLFAGMIVFALGHELGHIYHQHPRYDPGKVEAARIQEYQADQFGLSLLQQSGSAPVAAAFCFHILAHLEPFSGDPEFARFRATTYHPLSSHRVQAVADYLTSHAQEFGRDPADRARNTQLAVYAVEQLSIVADVLSNEHATGAFPRQIGRSATLSNLRTLGKQ